MISIRNYRKEDWAMVESWWAHASEISPVPGMMPEESSFIAEVDGIPALAVTVYLTNTPEIAYVENFIGNPAVKGGSRREASVLLSHHIAGFARGRGYRRLLCMTEKPKLMDRYQELGFSPTLSGVTTLVRVL